MSCCEIDLEQVKVQGFLIYVCEESEFDGCLVLFFLGDFGIGNLMEKDVVVDSVNQCLIQLVGVKMQCGCIYVYEVEVLVQQLYVLLCVYVLDGFVLVFVCFVDVQFDELNCM